MLQWIASERKLKTTTTDLLDQLSDHAVPVHVVVHFAVLGVGRLVEAVLEVEDLLNVLQHVDAVAVELHRAVLVHALHHERRLLPEASINESSISERSVTSSRKTQPNSNPSFVR